MTARYAVIIYGSTVNIRKLTKKEGEKVPLILYDEESGEVVGEYERGEFRIITKLQADSCRIVMESDQTAGGSKKRRSIIMESHGFIKNNYRELREVLKELDSYEAKTLSIMINYIEYWSNCVVLGRKKEITVKDIADFTGISERKMSDVLKTLKKKYLIATVSVGKGKIQLQYYVNPWVATKGSAVNATLKTMFRNYPIRTKGMKKWKEL